MYGHVITKFSWMGSLPHFLTHGAPLRASRESSAISSLNSLREAIFSSWVFSNLRRRPSEFTAILMFYFRRRATAALVPGFLCQSGRRRPENVSILSSLLSGLPQRARAWRVFLSLYQDEMYQSFFHFSCIEAMNCFILQHVQIWQS